MTKTTRDTQSKSSQPKQSASKQKTSQAAVPEAGAMQAAVQNPLGAAPSAILGLQRNYGNRAVGGLLQRAVPIDNKGGDLSSDVAGAVESARGGGHPLHSGVGAQVGQALGTDFSSVKVHTDTQSDTLNRSLNAQAFTLGSDIFFSKGAYDPASGSGRRLLAHELTHVVQQNGTKPRGVQTKLRVGPADDPFEREADQVADSIMSGTSARAQRRMVGERVRRKSLKPTIQRLGKKKKPPVISGPTDVTHDSLPLSKDNLSEHFPSYDKPFIEAGPNNSISGPMKDTVKTGDDVFKDDSERPTSENIILKAGKDGKESMKHSTTEYLDLLGHYVKKAGVDHGKITQTTDILSVDFQDVTEGRKTYNKLERAHESAIAQVASDEKNSSLPKKEKAKNKKKEKELASSKKQLLKALGESDFDKAHDDATKRVADAHRMQLDVTTEKATIEHLYDEVRGSKTTEHEQNDMFSRKEKKSQTYKDDLAGRKKVNADAARANAQQAKMSFDMVKVKRKQSDLQLLRITELGRVSGPIRKVMGSVAAGVVGAILNIVTLGALGLKSNTGVKGFQGEGLEKKGRAFKVTLFNDIRHQLTQFRTTVKSRPKGAKAVDYVSALLRAFNEIVLQNIVKIAGNVALIAGLLATVITAASLGFAAPAVVPLTVIATIAAIISLIAATAKVAVDVLRLTIDGFAALLNKDAKMTNVLKARVKQTGFEMLGDTLQAGGAATGTGTSGLIKTGEFLNAFNPSQMLSFNIGQLTATNSMGTTLGAMAGGLSQSVVAPLLGGPVAGGVAGSLDDRLGLQMAHPDERGVGGQSYLKSRSSFSSKPNKIDSEGGMPGWMKKEVENQNKLRKTAFKSRRTVAIAQMTGLSAKSGELGGKLGEGTTQSTKIESNVKGKGDSEDQALSQSQTGVLKEGSGAVIDFRGALDHSKGEISKLETE